MNVTWPEYGSASASVSVQRGPFEMVPHWLLDQTEISANSIRLYLVLRSFGDETRPSWPGRKLLGQRLGMSPSSVTRAMNDLLAAGALCYQQRPGEGKEMRSNLYHIHWDRNDNCRLFQGEGGRPLVNHPRPPVDYPRPPVDDPRPPVARELIPNELKPRETNSSIERVQKPITSDEDFEKFWNVYPRKTSKGHARRAWGKALRSVSLPEILDAAAQYRDDPNRDPAFTAHPATWLNGERWLDSPLPERNDSRSDKKVDEVRDVIARARARDMGALEA